MYIRAYDISVDTDIDIEVDDILDNANVREKQELFDALVEEGYTVGGDKVSIPQSEFNLALDNLKARYYSLSKQDEELIFKISKKY